MRPTRIVFGAFIAFIAGVAAIEGCSSFGETDPEISADADAADSSVADASEGSPLGEAGRFCKSVVPAPVLCDDFDTPANPWSALPTLANGGALGRVTDAAVSPPASLAATAAPIVAGDVAAYYRHDVASVGATAHVAFDFMVESVAGSPNYTNIAQLSIAEGSDSFYHLGVVLVPNLAIVEYRVKGGVNDLYETYLVGVARRDVWMHASVDVVFGDDAGAGAHVTAKLSRPGDKAEMLDHGLSVAPRTGPLSFFLGITFVRAPQQATALHFDNVVFDAK